jgi:hypothetical protein
MTYKQLSALTRDEARAASLASQITALRCQLPDAAPGQESRDIELDLIALKSELAELRGVIARADSDDEWRDR